MRGAKARGLVLAVCLGLSCAGLRGGSAYRGTPPNIVLFIVDDLGWQDVSVLMHTEQTGFNLRYRTPNLERLAARGVRFTSAYATSPVCTPTRASIMTGLHPARTRISDWTLHVDRDFSRKMKNLADPPWKREGTEPGPDLLTERLRTAGYHTMHVGKAHFGAIGTPGSDPLKLGFDANVAGHAAGAPASHLGQKNYGNGPASAEGGKKIWAVPHLEDHHGTDRPLAEALTIEAEDLLTRAVERGQPFYLNFAHYAVHAPIQIDQRFVDRYLEAGLDQTEAAYASMIEGVDDSLGRVMDRLEQLGAADSTLIVFYSDNGGLTAHARGKTPDGTGKDTHNRPLRSGKGSAYEGGVRVPMVVGWAGDGPQHPFAIPRGTTEATPILSTDFYPTFLELAGEHASTPDGTSLVPLFTGGGPLKTSRPMAFHYPHKWGPKGDGYEPFTAWREGRWRIVYLYESERWELHDLAADLGQTTDLMQTEPALAAGMQTALRGWMRDLDAQRPIDSATGEMVPVP